jgi:hypothetical protein
MTDKYDEVAWKLAQDILSNKLDTRDAAESIAAALRKAVADAAKIDEKPRRFLSRFY